jgi:leishmanolysin
MQVLAGLFIAIVVAPCFVQCKSSMDANGAYHVCIHGEIIRTAKNSTSDGQDPSVILQYNLGGTVDAAETRFSAEGRHFVPQALFENVRFQSFFNVDGNGICHAVGDVVTTYQNRNAVCNSSDVLTSAKEEYIYLILGNAKARLSAALNVDPVVGNLVMPYPTCGSFPGVAVPLEHQTTGVPNADYVLYVTSVPLSVSNPALTIAWGMSCAQDQNGRKIVGQVNFVPAALTNAEVLDPVNVDRDIIVAMHEMSHALGFTPPFFANGYINMSNVRLSGGMISYNDSVLGKMVTKMTTPRTLRQARNHFNCPTLDGLEIEDQGGPGTASTHWEKRIYYEEYIAGILSTPRPFFSSLTLGYFEDTGFYTANYGSAEDAFMNWGRNASCTFVTQKCDSTAIQETRSEYCFDTDQTHGYCSFDYLSRGFCGVGEFGTPIASNFQYFGNDYEGGLIFIADYCPVGLGYSNTVCIDGSTTDPQDIYGSSYGPQSRCFQSNLVVNSQTPGSLLDTRCFNLYCTTNGTIEIGIKGMRGFCPLDGSPGNADLSNVAGYSGTVVCPAAFLMCGMEMPTPAPTPAPPTPVPPPALPGYTPVPPMIMRSSSELLISYTPLPQCSMRSQCAQNLTSLMPACRKLADSLVRCFGTTCDGELQSWLRANGLLCEDSISFGNEYCIEGPSGGVAMCWVSGNGPGL